MKDYLIKDMRGGQEVSFRMLRGEMADVLLSVAMHEDRMKQDVNCWDYYEVCELTDNSSAYQPVVYLPASDFARAW